MLPTGDYSGSEEEENYPKKNVRATYAKAKFARIKPIIQLQNDQVEIEPRPARTRESLRASYYQHSSAINCQ
jgi:hypothetical protein